MNVNLYDPGIKVWVKTVREEIEKWLPGDIVLRESTLTYIVDLLGQRRYVHCGYLIPRV